MAAHVRHNSWYISLPSFAKQQREMTKFWAFGQGERRRLIFRTFNAAGVTERETERPISPLNSI